MREVVELVSGDSGNRKTDPTLPGLLLERKRCQISQEYRRLPEMRGEQRGGHDKGIAPSYLLSEHSPWMA